MKDLTRVLVLEDDFNMLESLLGVLRFHDYDPRGASDPQEAIDMAKIIPFQLAVSDIRMAGPTDGLGAIRGIKKFQPKIKVIMITGFADDDAARQAVGLMVDDYVHKPIKLQAFMEVVERVLHPPRSPFAPLAGLRKLLAAPIQLMNQAKAQKVGRLVVLLEQEKQRVVQAFFVALRAKGLSKSASLELWDQLEKLEGQWVQLASGPAEESIQALGVSYRKVFERLAHFQETGKVAASPPRDARAVTRQGFNTLLDQVQAGRVAQEELLLLLESRLQPGKATSLPLALQDLLKQLNPS